MFRAATFVFVLRYLTSNFCGIACRKTQSSKTFCGGSAGTSRRSRRFADDPNFPEVEEGLDSLRTGQRYSADRAQMFHGEQRGNSESAAQNIGRIRQNSADSRKLLVTCTVFPVDSYY